MTDLLQDLKKLYTAYPIWEPQIWLAAQNKNYEEVESLLKSFFENDLPEDEWTEIYWPGILAGIEMFRGDLGVEEWSGGVLPAVARALRSSASDEILSSIYASLRDEDLKKLRALMLNAISEADAKIHTPPPSPTPIKQQTSAAQPVINRFVPINEMSSKQKNTPTKDDANLLTPAFRPNGSTQQTTPQQKNAGPAPFMIHEETQINPTSSHGIAPLDRPQFFKSTVEEKPYSPPTTARLEIGDDAVLLPKTEQVGQTKREEPRVVNYTAPITQADPFVRPAQEKKPINEAPAHQNVSPENVINLKDLPK